MNNLLIKNCLKHVHHSDFFIALFDLNSQHGLTHSITIRCSISCLNNLLFKNYLEHVHHSDLFVSLFDLNSLSLHYTCQNTITERGVRMLIRNGFEYVF